MECITLKDNPEISTIMPTAYQLRIQLCDLKPAIYRDVLVDPSITLRKLHKVIQTAMGWEDEHLYGFALPQGRERYWRVPMNRKFEPPTEGGFGFGFAEPANNDAKYSVGEVLRAPKDKLLYMYDFGDDWEHTITLTAIGEANEALPHLMKAANGCPPENIGGVTGAVHWASVWYDKSHPEHDTALMIFGEREPNWLDFPALQKAVDKLKPRVKRTASNS
jgi:Plasmid pRiA4b ORF-3-like protein